MRSLLLDCTTIYECGFSFTVISGSNKIYTSINTYNIRKNHWLCILQSYILKLAKPLATTEAMRNKAVLLFVYWNFWINSRKRTKKNACGRTTDGKKSNLVQEILQNIVPFFGVPIEHQVTTHDVGVIAGKLRFNEGLRDILPMLCDKHQTRHGCTDIFCGLQIVGEHCIAEQLTADPVRRTTGNIKQVLQFIRFHLMLNHDTGGILAEELTASL